MIKNDTQKVESTFLQNRSLLKLRHPEIEKSLENVQNSFAGDTVVKGDDLLQKERYNQLNHLFYGGEDPLTVMERITGDLDYQPYDILFIIGMGLGHLPVHAIQKCVGKPRIIIIEPRETIFLQALHETDLRSILSNARTELFVGPQIHIQQIIEKYRTLIPIGVNKILVHPGYEKYFEKTIRPIKQELSERIGALRDSFHTTKKYGRQMFDNAIANLPSVFAGTAMKRLRNSFSDMPAVCIAAGPSLDQAMTDLEKIKDRVLLVACDSAVGALLAKGIKPHIVVTTDIFETNVEKLKPYIEDLSETIFVFGIESTPDNIRLFMSPKRVAVSAYNALLLNWLDPKLDLQCRFPPSTSVSHLAVFTALGMGADPIVQVGMDLAYIEGKSHSYGSAFFSSLQSEKKVKTHGNDGSMLITSPQFIADKLLIENVVNQCTSKFINTSVNGAYIKGTQIKSLAEVVDVLLFDRTKTPQEALASISWAPAATVETAALLIDELVARCRRFRDVCDDQDRRILETIQSMANEKGRAAWLAAVKAERNRFSTCKAENSTLIQMIEEIMLGQIQEIRRQNEIRLAGDQADEKTDGMDALRSIREHYAIFVQGVEYQIQQLELFSRFCQALSITGGQSGVSDHEWPRHLQQASIYETHGQLWLARQTYIYCMKQCPSFAAASCLDLCRAYMKEGLWLSAQQLLDQAEGSVVDPGKIQELKNDFQKGIQDIFQKIKSEWMAGNIYTTRKLMHQYLTLCPDDPQINELKTVIHELDEAFSREFVENEEKRSTPIEPNKRLDQAAEKIKTLEFEQGIGILEGVIVDYQQARGTLREQIGDIRRMQNDYDSALWNYHQVLKATPENVGVKKKIQAICDKKATQ